MATPIKRKKGTVGRTLLDGVNPTVVSPAAIWIR
jgi:hypothetical protein